MPPSSSFPQTSKPSHQLPDPCGFYSQDHTHGCPLVSQPGGKQCVSCRFSGARIFCAWFCTALLQAWAMCVKAFVMGRSPSRSRKPWHWLLSPQTAQLTPVRLCSAVRPPLLFHSLSLWVGVAITLPHPHLPPTQIDATPARLLDIFPGMLPLEDAKDSTYFWSFGARRLSVGHTKAYCSHKKILILQRRMRPTQKEAELRTRESQHSWSTWIQPYLQPTPQSSGFPLHEPIPYFFIF